MRTNIDIDDASSTQTMRMAFHAIKANEGDIFLAGGVECVSQYTGFAGAGGVADEAINPRFAESIARTAQVAADKSGSPARAPRRRDRPGVGSRRSQGRSVVRAGVGAVADHTGGTHDGG